VKSNHNFNILFLLVISITTLSCKQKVEETISISTNQVITTSINEKAKISIDSFSIGKKEMLLENLNSKVRDEPSLLTEIFKYYDTINGVASSHFKETENSQYVLFYKPDVSDSKELEDSFFLKSEEGYDFFKVVKEFSFYDNKKILIFEGRSSNEDYDGNIVYTNRKDIVTIDSKNNIVDAMNVYYSYSDGIFAQTKLFYIDENHIISIRYYSEDEEGNTTFSEIEKYEITKEGGILNLN